MKKSIKIIAAIFIFGLTTALAAAQDLPSMKTLKAMLLANMYFIQKNPDPGQSLSGNTPTNNWSRGVYFEGLLSLYKVNPNEAFLNYLLNWGKANDWSLAGGNTTRDPFNQCSGQTYIDMYLLDRYREERIKKVRECIDKNLASDQVNDWNSTDAIQMAMPLYARLGRIYNNEKYYDRMNEIYMFSKTQVAGKGLYNPEDHLWYSDKDFLPPYKEPNGQACYWSRGNGWVIAAIVRTLEFLPDKGRYRKEYEATLKEMLEALVPFQRGDGYWNVSLKDPEHFGGKELSGTSLIVYGMAWSINNGLIGRKEYLPVVMKAWDSILSECIHPDGSLGYVQGTGRGPADGQPVTFDKKPDSEDFGLGCFLLAGTEIFKLQKDMEPKVKPEKVKPEKNDKEKKTRKK